MEDTTRRDALARNLCARICDDKRTFDELRVLDWVLDGVEVGEQPYGGLRLRSDDRNFPRERAKEARDSLFYAACEALRAVDVEEDLIDAELAREKGLP